MMDIETLCQDSHQISKDKGWLEDPRPFSAITALIHSELSEALEDYRSNHPLDEIYYENNKKNPLRCTDEALKGLTQEKRMEAGIKPCGIPIEFADVIIRIAQYCGTYGWDLAGTVAGVIQAAGGKPHGAKLFEDTIALLHADISMAYLASLGIQLPDGMPTTPLAFFASAWLTVYAFCEKNGIDLDAAILEKQEFNKTRPHKHGGKKI
jgi:NTP pyrophosphatase (non-canonical NTP hydrolase)